MVEKSKKNTGITMISLIMTIIIIIIIAGVGLATLTGENGVVNKANKAAKMTEVARVEEEAGLIYLDLVKSNYLENRREVKKIDLINVLASKGYQIGQETTITDFNLDKDDIVIPANGTETIKLTFETSPEVMDYYILIKGEYYKISLKDLNVTIDRTPTVLFDGIDLEKLTATITSGTSVTVSKIAGDVITLKADDILGDSTVEISYGDNKKECSAKVLLKPFNEKENTITEINTDYGLVDVIWLSGETNTYSSKPNVPNLYTDLGEEKLEPVTWTYYKDGITENEKIVNWVEDTTAKTNWYSYTAEKGNDGKVDNTTSMWANAKDKNGSYFVWIPRYAYRITYYSDPAYTNLTGYYDGYGMWSAENGNKKFNLDEGIETVSHNGKQYIVHPAFMEDINKKDSLGNDLEDFARGGWDKNLTGIWVAKYEMSNGSNSSMLSVPGVKSIDNTTIGNMHTKAIAYDVEKQSHMLKNSEWGAVAYLTHSQYGRNGHEIDENSNRITGYGAEIGDSGEYYLYSTIEGAKASTTGNIYGIYDMAGCAWEHTGGFDRLGQSSRFKHATAMMKKDSAGKYISTKYATAYSNGENERTSKTYVVGKIGDATKEVRATSRETNWFSDNATIVILGAPFFGRGGGAGEDASLGVFYSDSTMGQQLPGVSFRISLSE